MKRWLANFYYSHRFVCNMAITYVMLTLSINIIGPPSGLGGWLCLFALGFCCIGLVDSLLKEEYEKIVEERRAALEKAVEEAKKIVELARRKQEDDENK